MEEREHNTNDPSVEDDAGSIPYPEEGDTLFAGAGDWQFNACMNIRPPDWYPYTEGYRRAADIIIEHLMLRDRNGVDLLVYPIAFLYRHHLELRLKELIREGSLLLDRECELRKTHDLSKLWPQCRSIVKEVWPEGSDSELDAIEECIEEFSTVDRSESFRYPVDTKGNPSLPSVPDHVNVRHLADTMTKIANLLRGAQMGIEVYLESKSEAEAYKRDMCPEVDWC
jgi:hypothetical protein